MSQIINYYDISKDECNLKRYFIFKQIELCGKKLFEFECRKCGYKYRTNVEIDYLHNHLKICDTDAWKVYMSKLMVHFKTNSHITASNNCYSIQSSNCMFNGFKL